MSASERVWDAAERWVVEVRVDKDADQWVTTDGPMKEERAVLWLIKRQCTDTSRPGVWRVRCTEDQPTT